MGDHTGIYLFQNQTYPLLVLEDQALIVSSLLCMTIMIQTELLLGCRISQTWTMVLTLISPPTMEGDQWI